MFKKVITLLFGTAFMAVLMLAAGGVYLLPETVMGVYLYADVWNAVGGLFSLMLVPGFVVGYAACQSRILGAVWFIGFVILGFISGISICGSLRLCCSSFPTYSVSARMSAIMMTSTPTTSSVC